MGPPCSTFLEAGAAGRGGGGDFPAKLATVVFKKVQKGRRAENYRESGNIEARKCHFNHFKYFLAPMQILAHA